MQQDGVERIVRQANALVIFNKNSARALAPKIKTYWPWSKFSVHLKHVKDQIHTPDPVYEDSSCGCLGPDVPVRKVAIKVVHHWAFDSFILSLIVINCIITFLI